MSAQDIARQDIEDISEVVGTKAGARLLSRILSEANIFNGSFVSDPALSQFMAGKRSIGLMSLNGLTLDDQRMVREGE